MVVGWCFFCYLKGFVIIFTDAEAPCSVNKGYFAMAVRPPSIIFLGKFDENISAAKITNTRTLEVEELMGSN